MKNVMGSIAESEFGSLLHNVQEAEPISITLHKMGHTQTERQMKNDHYTAHGITNNTVHQKLSKSTDMRFYWIQDQTKQ